MAQKRKKSFMGQMINTSVGNMVGIGLIGATAPMAQSLTAGSMERTMASTAVGLQGVAMLGPNLRFAQDSLGGSYGQRRRRKKRR